MDADGREWGNPLRLGVDRFPPASRMCGGARERVFGKGHRPGVIPAQATGLGKPDKKQTSPVGATQIVGLERIQNAAIPSRNIFTAQLRRSSNLLRLPSQCSPTVNSED